jgi:hypothetical protein
LSWPPEGSLIHLNGDALGGATEQESGKVRTRKQIAHPSHPPQLQPQPQPQPQPPLLPPPLSLLNQLSLSIPTINPSYRHHPESTHSPLHRRLHPHSPVVVTELSPIPIPIPIPLDLAIAVRRVISTAPRQKTTESTQPPSNPPFLSTPLRRIPRDPPRV